MILALSYALALCIGLLIIAPPIGYAIPVVVNSSQWVYMVVVSGFLGMMLGSRDLHWSIKVLAFYLFGSCFLSAVPYISFNAYVLIVVCLWFFLAFQKADYRIILNVIVAAFWLEVILTGFQLFGKDTLLNFHGVSFSSGETDEIVKQWDKVVAKWDGPSHWLMEELRPEKVFLGTVMQHMRFASVLALMTPFLVMKSRWYILPVVVLCALSQSSAFAFSLAAAGIVYVLIHPRFENCKGTMFGLIVLLVLAFSLWDNGSVKTAFLEGRWPVWGIILKTWVLNTSMAVPPAPLTGPIDWKCVFFGHGIDTFMPLFPIYKHDPNPFAQAHNCWFQMLWEIGLVGTGLVVAYCARLIRQLYKLKRHGLIAGLTLIGTNMVFVFPTRMTQTVLLMVAFVALCEVAIKSKGLRHA